MRTLIVCILSLFLVACATPYQPKGFTGGYETEQLDELTYKITYKGNTLATDERIEDFAYLRCAQITREKGYTYFDELDGKHYLDTTLYSREPRTYTTVVINEDGSLSAVSQHIKGGTYANERSTVVKVISLSNKRKNTDTNYEASLVIKLLKDKYKLSSIK